MGLSLHHFPVTITVNGLAKPYKMRHTHTHTREWLVLHWEGQNEQMNGTNEYRGQRRGRLQDWQEDRISVERIIRGHQTLWDESVKDVRKDSQQAMEKKNSGRVSTRLTLGELGSRESIDPFTLAGKRLWILSNHGIGSWEQRRCPRGPRGPPVTSEHTRKKTPANTLFTNSTVHQTCLPPLIK